jgi:PAB-dependent poly(A)-specific ribonuclease subunit 2
MEGIYPLGAATTLPARAEAAGRYAAAVTALAFDPLEELVWAGTEDGRVTVLHSPSLERHAACQAHPVDHAVQAVLPVGGNGGGAVSVSATHVCYHSSGCVKRWGIPEGAEDPHSDPLTCGAVDAHALGGSGRAFIGRTSAAIAQVDLGAGRVSLRADVSGASCTAGTAVMEWGAPRGLLACGGFGGELVLRDPRGGMRADVALATPAHTAGISALAAKGDLVVTCGLTHRAGMVCVDPFVKVVDVRMGARVLNVLQFPAGPVAARFHPRHTSSVMLCSGSGMVQAMDAGEGGTGYQNYRLQLDVGLTLSHCPTAPLPHPPYGASNPREASAIDN